MKGHLSFYLQCNHDDDNKEDKEEDDNSNKEDKDENCISVLGFDREPGFWEGFKDIVADQLRKLAQFREHLCKLT